MLKTKTDQATTASRKPLFFILPIQDTHDNVGLIIMGRYVKSLIDRGGLSCLVIDVECHIANGLPSLAVIGYASKAVEEARDRLRASFNNSSLQLPKKRITINLAPADIPKESTSMDLAMAVSVLLVSGQVDEKRTANTIFIGELGLDGAIRPVKGVIGKLLEGQKAGFKNFYLPSANLSQANLIKNLSVRPVDDLRQVFLDLSGSLPIKPISTNGSFEKEAEATSEELLDIAEISGQLMAKRAIEIAAAGHHNILLYGPPGTGKTMLAKAMPGILPGLTYDEVLEVTHLHSLGGDGTTRVITSRPFRSPHHTASTTALIGGGSNPKPGEVSLAHRGVLFLDELAEFNRSSLESLRQPLEDGKVTISRVKDTATYPANFILVATQNPCPCGYLGTNKACICTPSAIDRYHKKVSGPLLDRIDLHLPVSGIDHKELLAKDKIKPQSLKLRSKLEQAYLVQAKRFGRAGTYNSSMNNRQIKDLAQLSSPAKDLLDSAAQKMDLSARAYVRSVKVARTIADLEGSGEILPGHISEALQFRQPMDYLNL